MPVRVPAQTTVLLPFIVLILFWALQLGAQPTGLSTEALKSAGGQLLLNGSVAFEASFRTCPGCTGFFWKDSPGASPEELLPAEAARKQFARRVGRISLSGPGRLIVVTEAFDSGEGTYPAAQVRMYTYPAGEASSDFRSVSRDRWSTALAVDQIQEDDPAFIPEGTLRELEVLVEMQPRTNHPEPGHLLYPAPQGLRYEVWFFPEPGGIVVEVINHNHSIPAPAAQTQFIQVYNNSGHEKLPVRAGLQYRFAEPGLMKLPDGSFLVSRAGGATVEVLNWQAKPEEDLLDLLIQHGGKPLSLFTPDRNNPQMAQVTEIMPPAAIPGEGNHYGLFFRDGQVQAGKLRTEELQQTRTRRASNPLLVSMPLAGELPLTGGQFNQLNWPAVFARANQAPLLYSIRNRRNGGGRKKLSYSLRLAPGTLVNFSTRVKARLDFDLALLTPDIMEATQNTPLAIRESKYFLPDQNMTLFSLAPGISFGELIQTLKEKGSGWNATDRLFRYQWRIISSGVWLSYDEAITFAVVQAGRFDRLHHRTEQRLTIPAGKSAFLCPQSTFQLHPLTHWTGISLEQCR